MLVSFGEYYKDSVFILVFLSQHKMTSTSLDALNRAFLRQPSMTWPFPIPLFKSRVKLEQIGLRGRCDWQYWTMRTVTKLFCHSLTGQCSPFLEWSSIRVERHDLMKNEMSSWVDPSIVVTHTLMDVKYGV